MSFYCGSHLPLSLPTLRLIYSGPHLPLSRSTLSHLLWSPSTTVTIYSWSHLSWSHLPLSLSTLLPPLLLLISSGFHLSGTHRPVAVEDSTSSRWSNLPNPVLPLQVGRGSTRARGGRLLPPPKSLQISRKVKFSIFLSLRDNILGSF